MYIRDSAGWIRTLDQAPAQACWRPGRVHLGGRLLTIVGAAGSLMPLCPAQSIPAWSAACTYTWRPPHACQPFWSLHASAVSMTHVCACSVIGCCSVEVIKAMQHDVVPPLRSASAFRLHDCGASGLKQTHKAHRRFWWACCLRESQPMTDPSLQYSSALHGAIDFIAGLVFLRLQLSSTR